MSSSSSTTSTKPARVSLRPGGGLRPGGAGKSLRPGTGPKVAATTKTDANLKAQTGPRKMYSFVQLLLCRSQYQDVLASVPFIEGVTGKDLGVSLSESLPVVQDEDSALVLWPGQEAVEKEPDAPERRKLNLKKRSKIAAIGEQDNKPAAAAASSSNASAEGERTSNTTRKTTAASGPVLVNLEAPLQKSSRAWKPASSISDEEKLQRKLNGILNKLTVEKFDILSEQIVNVCKDNAKSIATMTVLITILFDKALSEAHFAEMYSKLALVLSNSLEPVQSATTSQQATFKQMLLNQCQVEFERGLSKLVIADDASKEDRRLAVIKQKKLMLGNISFIGELFKKGLIPENIMHICINNLVSSTSSQEIQEQDIERLAKLLQTVGSKIDSSPKGREAMSKYMARLGQLSVRPGLDSRTRFMLLDAIDLRSNKWTPRRAEDKAQRLEDIHREYAKQLANTDAAAFARLMKNDNNLLKISMSKEGGGEVAFGDEQQRNKDLEAMIGGGKFSLDGLTRNSDAVSPYAQGAQTAKDRYGRSSLNKPQQQGEQSSSSSSSSSSNVSQQFKLLDSKLSSTGFKKRAEPVVQKPQPQQQQSSSSSSPRKAKLAVNVAKLTDADKIQQLLDGSFIRKFFTSGVIEPAAQAFASIPFDGQKYNAFQVVEKALDLAIEAGRHEQKMAAELLAGLHSAELLSQHELDLGITRVLEFYSDIEIDVPALADYMGQILAGLIKEKSISCSLVASAMAHEQESGKSAKLLGHIFQILLMTVDAATIHKDLIGEFDVKSVLNNAPFENWVNQFELVRLFA